jgi:hypothetical protein
VHGRTARQSLLKYSKRDLGGRVQVQVGRSTVRGVVAFSQNRATQEAARRSRVTPEGTGSGPRQRNQRRIQDWPAHPSAWLAWSSVSSGIVRQEKRRCNPKVGGPRFETLGSAAFRPRRYRTVAAVFGYSGSEAGDHREDGSRLDPKRGRRRDVRLYNMPTGESCQVYKIFDALAAPMARPDALDVCETSTD